MALGGNFFVEDDLANAGAIAQVEEDEIAVVAAAVHPAHQHHVFARIGGAQISAEVSALQIA